MSFISCVLVASSLDQKIENLAFIVDRPPKPELFAANQHGHLVEMSLRSRPMARGEQLNFAARVAAPRSGSSL
jgi:hypothetical protein